MKSKILDFAEYTAIVVAMTNLFITLIGVTL